MANYDRRFLIPYLRDLYSMELLLVQQQKEYEKLSTQLQSQAALLKHDSQPKAEKKHSPAGVVVLWLTAFGLFCSSALCATLAVTRDEQFWAVAIACLLLGMLTMVILVCNWVSYRKKSRRYKHYRQKLQDYQDLASEREKRSMQFLALQEQLEALAQRIREGQQLRQELYAVNVIPSHYRTLPAVRFLFEYFLTSKSENIDAVLQIYAVESLRKSKDQTDERRSTALLLHRTQLAQQQMEDERNALQYEEQMQQIAELEPNWDRRAQYRKMISGGMDLSRYISRQDPKS